ncbi:hypothetical protein SLEP1_g37755 [Rubroshorea leprosula]|uniref:Reverse transcriptase domain-containing protein n=1 Tax=Rubroshorea leprosula TaxID=152421 RepID=A0AAV5KW06_9ROSI|nr:hypothetical protein SLEP1_g37755 [Rubroshorea leprosula]
MRERGRERERGVVDGRRSLARRTTLNQERAGSRGRSRTRRWKTEERRERQHVQNQTRKWKNEGAYDKGLYKQATPYFFSNFPDDWSYADMWRTFQKFGRVYDIYSPNRRSRNGSRFGFVRFLDVINKRELEMQLDQIWVGGQKLWVNTPRYDDAQKQEGEWRKYQAVAPKKQDRSYAEVVLGLQVSGPKKGSDLLLNQEVERRPTSSRIKTKIEHESSGNRRVWKEKGIGKRWEGMEYNAKPEEYEWLKGCYVGTVHSVEMVRNLQEKFYMEGYFSCRVRAMGGKMVLLDCEEKEELKDLVEMASDWLSQWFEDVRPWTPESVANERFVWVRCQGTPLNVWGLDFFEKMACSWGKFICLDDNTSKKMRFDIARFLISTPIRNTISFLRQVQINGRIYNLKFTEEEFTNSFFSLKHDFFPAYQSDSVENEGWSTESEREKQGSVFAEEFAQVNGSGLQEEDDDVAGWQRRGMEKPREHATSRKGKQCNSEENSLEYIQNLKEVVFIVGAEEERLLQGDVALSGRLGGEEGEHLGLSEQSGPIEGSIKLGLDVKSRRGESSLQLGLTEHDLTETEGKLNPQAENTDFEESTNMGRTQTQKGKEIKSWSIIDGSSRNKEVEQNSLEFAEDDPFWNGFETEQRGIEEWIKKQREEGSTKKKRRIKMCRSVYAKARAVGMGPNSKKGRRKQCKQDAEGRSEPSFLPGSKGKIASDSVGDSGIQNCNRWLKKQMKNNLALEIWDLAKKLGAVAEDDREIIQRIEEMESRDSRDKAEKTTHGSGEARKRRQIRELVKKEKVEFLAIQETKLQVVDNSICRGVWGTDDMEWISKPSVGMSGGLLCVWNPKVLKLIEVIEGDNFIGVTGVWGEKEILVHILNIYSPCQVTGKRALWEELQHLISSRNGNWCLAGDFNAVRSIEERAGCWFSVWGDVKQWGLRRSVSDHCPILLKEEKIDWGPKPFKFFDAWLEQPDCKEIIRTAWNSCEINGGKGYKLKEKLKMTKKALKDWSSKSMADVDRKISESEMTIAEIDEQGEKSTLSDTDIEKRRNCFLDLWKHLRIKERMWQQKSRMAWLKEGDANTKFFHRCVKGRSRRNEINFIQIKGVQHTGVLGIKKAVAEHFEKLFTEENWQRPRLDGISFNQISGVDNELLTATFSEVEIKQAIWDCGSSKSPGPDGFNFRFIKEMWEDIKSEIIDFVQEFHRLGRLVRGSNASFIVLIPKVENPQRIEEFRPISLIGVMYKIIAKLLANRLRKVLPKIIGEQQMAFIGGRQLVDGVVIANEVIDEAKKKKKKSFLFKVDFEKAYDNVCWDFIDYMMRRMGFNTIWRNWIRECLASSSVSVLINGSPTNQFPISKGIRQGDPLSPFLFLIVAEGLNGLVSSAVEKQLYKGVTVGKEGVSVSHLQFADDTIFFGEASDDNIGAIKSIMRTFELVSGLKINFGKSQLMGIGVEDNWRNKMACRLCCKEGEFPFKYLGIPIGGNHKRVAMWKPMVDSFRKKLSTWKGRYLSLGGRITLINSVLSSLPVFLMSIYLIPKGILYSIDKIRRSFLWGGGGEERKIKWVSWDKVCKKKEEGGLGVRELRKFNLALLGKWWGRLAENREGLWKRVIIGKYGERGGHWMDWIKEKEGLGSSWWRDVCCIDKLDRERVGWLSEGFRLKLGDGKRVSFWWDNWCGVGHLANKYPRLYLISTGKDNKCHQMGNDGNEQWSWNLQWRRKLFEWENEEAKELQQWIEDKRIKQGRPDSWEWVHDKDGQYSTKTAYSILTKDQIETNEISTFKRIWNPKFPSKVSAFNWQLLLDRIPTKVNLIIRGILGESDDGKCVFCKEEDEDSKHLFLKCKITSWVWQECAKWWGTEIRLERDCWNSFQRFGKWSKDPKVKEGWDCIWSTVIWTVWLARNQMIFQEKKTDPRKLLEIIQVRSFQWSTANLDRYAFTLTDWLINPVDCLKSLHAGRKKRV